MTGKQQLAETIRRVAPVTNRLVNRIDACPHEAAMLGYLLGLRRGYLESPHCDCCIDDAAVEAKWISSEELIRAIKAFITGVTKYGLPD